MINNNEDLFKLFLKSFSKIITDFRVKQACSKQVYQADLEALEKIVRPQKISLMFNRLNHIVGTYGVIHDLPYIKSLEDFLKGSVYRREVIEPLKELLREFKEKDVIDNLVIVNDALKIDNQELMDKKKTLSREKKELTQENDDAKKRLLKIEKDISFMKKALLSQGISQEESCEKSTQDFEPSDKKPVFSSSMGSESSQMDALSEECFFKELLTESSSFR